MKAALPVYFIVDAVGRPVAHTDGYDATRYAVRHLLEEGEEAGPLRTFAAGGRELERADLVDGRVVWTGRQGLRESLR